MSGLGSQIIKRVSYPYRYADDVDGSASSHFPESTARVQRKEEPGGAAENNRQRQVNRSIGSVIGPTVAPLAVRINIIDNIYKCVSIEHIFNYATWRNNQWQR